MRRSIYYYDYLDGPYAELTARFRGDPTTWLPLPALAVPDGFEVALDAGDQVPAALRSRSALVTVGPPSGADNRELRAVSWRGAQRDELYPVLEADLELAPLSDDLCQLTLVGSYRPPLSVVGSAADRVVGHRVAEAVVRAFVLAVGRRLTAARVPSRP